MAESKSFAGARGRGDLVFAMGLMVASLVAGYAINAFRAQPLSPRYESKAARMDRAILALPRHLGDGAVMPVPDLTLNEFVAYTKARRGLVLDARPEIFYRLGHVPYALSLPRDKFDQAYALLRGRLETDFAVPLVVYCSSPTCEDAGLVQAALRKLGFTQVAVFRGGWAEWTAAHQEEEHLP